MANFVLVLLAAAGLLAMIIVMSLAADLDWRGHIPDAALAAQLAADRLPAG